MNYLSMIPDPSAAIPAPSSTQTSKENSVERILSHPQQDYDHLRPSKLSYEADPPEVTRWKETFTIWFKKMCAPASIDHDMDYLRYTVLSMVEKIWSSTLQSHQECKKAKIDKIFAICNH